MRQLTDKGLLGPLNCKDPLVVVCGTRHPQSGLCNSLVLSSGKNVLLNHLVVVPRGDPFFNQNQEKLLSKKCGGARESCAIIVGDAEY